MNLFRQNSHDALKDARENLTGLTHYVDQSTLTFHKSRVIEGHVLCDGLVYGIIESAAADPANMKRGFRGVLFDITGNVISRRSLSDLLPTRKQAVQDMYAVLASLDILTWTLDAIARERGSVIAEMDRMEITVRRLASSKVIEANRVRR